MCKAPTGADWIRIPADEYDGNLRLVTTVDRYNSKTGKEKHHNALYVLNGELEVPFPPVICTEDVKYVLRPNKL